MGGIALKKSSRATLTEGFIYSPLHPDRIDFTEEGIKTDKRTKNEKHFIGETLSFFRLKKKTALELIIAEYCGYDPSIVFWKGLNISYLYLPDLLCLFFFFAVLWATNTCILNY